MARRPRRPTRISARLDGRDLLRGLAGAAATPGRSLAQIGAETGPISAVIEGGFRLTNALADQAFQQRRATVLQAAETEGLTAGQRAALEGDLLTLQDAETEAGQAFNRAGLQALVSNMELGIRGRIDTLREKHPTDPAEFERRFEEDIAAPFLGELPEEVRGVAAAELDRLRLNELNGIAIDTLREAEAANNADLAVGATEYLARAMDARRRGDVEAFTDFRDKYFANTRSRTDLSEHEKAFATGPDFERLERREDFIGDLGRAIADEGLDGADMMVRVLAKSSDIVDPNERDALVKEGRAIVATARVSRERAVDGAVRQARAAIEGGATVASLPAETRAVLAAEGKVADLEKRERQIREGMEPVTNDEAYYRLSRMATDEPGAFRRLDLLEFRDRLDDADWNRVTSWQRDAEPGEKTTPTGVLRSRTQMVNQALKAAGIDPNAKSGTGDAKRVAAFHRAIDQMAEDEGVERPADLQAIIDRALLQGTLRDSGFAGFFESDRRFFEVMGTEEEAQFVVDIPEADRQQIRQALIDAGREPTETAIRALYEAVHFGGGRAPESVPAGVVDEALREGREDREGR